MAIDKDTQFFCRLSSNPTFDESKRWLKGDCVIRAFSMATGLTWLDAFDRLCAHARKTYDVPNSDSNYPKVFEEFGLIAKQVKVIKGESRMTVKDFCQQHPKGAYILRCANHLTAVVNGVCYDTWNPSEKCVYRYWEATHYDTDARYVHECINEYL